MPHVLLCPCAPPLQGHGAIPGDPAWAGAYPIIVQAVADYYADQRIIETHYDGVKLFVDFEIAKAATEGGLLTYGVS